MNKIGFTKRRKRTRSKISGTQSRPRLSVYRSNKSMYIQLVDDEKGKTMASVSALELKDKKTKKMTKTETAYQLGEKIAEKAVKMKITRVVFDKSGYRYHGRVKAVADGARAKGLQF